MVFDQQPVEASGNYGTMDNGLACQFLAEFPDNDALETLSNFTCTEYDATSCQATVFQSTEPVSPTRPPRPSDAPTGGATPNTGSVAAIGRVFSSMLMTIAGLLVGALLMG